MTRNNIINAPSKFDLMIAFFDNPKGDRRSVSFTIQGPSCSRGQRQIEVVINQLAWEDGSGESWYFEGYCKTNVGQPQNRSADVVGWFRTSSRGGWIDIDAPAQSDAGGIGAKSGPDFRQYIGGRI